MSKQLITDFPIWENFPLALLPGMEPRVGPIGELVIWWPDKNLHIACTFSEVTGPTQENIKLMIERMQEYVRCH